MRTWRCSWGLGTLEGRVCSRRTLSILRPWSFSRAPFLRLMTTSCARRPSHSRPVLRRFRQYLVVVVVVKAPGVAAVPAVPAAPLPSSVADDDVRLGIAEWLGQMALPLELCSVPRDRREAWLDVAARLRFVHVAQREAVVRSRFGVLLQSLPVLSVVVGGVLLAAQFGLIGRLAVELLPSFNSGSVASFQALNDIAGRYAYVLDEGGGPSSVAPDQRVRRMLDEHTAEGHRRTSAGASSGSHAIGASADGGVQGASPAAGMAMKAPAFARVNHDSLERFVRTHSVRFMAKMNTPESDAFRAAGSLGPLGDRDPGRILRTAFHRDWGVTFLQFVPAKRNCGHMMFDCVAPFRHHLYNYVSDTVFQNADGTIDDDLTKGLLDEKMVDSILAGEKWDTLDLFHHLEGKLRAERRNVPRRNEDTRWPGGVFRDATLLTKVQTHGDALFSAFGYLRRSSTGFHGCVDHLIQYLNKHDSAEDAPEGELYGIYQEFMQDAMGAFKSALESTADGSFPVFSGPNPRWLRRVRDLTQSAQRRTADRKHEGATAAASLSSPSVQFIGSSSSRFSNVSIDGLKRPASPALSVGSDSGDRKLARGSLGSESWRVLVNNSATLRIKYPSAQDPANGSTWEYKAALCRRELRKREGSDAKCLACAACRTPSLRYALCPYAGSPGHTSETDTAHTFASDPWIWMNTPQFATKV